MTRKYSAPWRNVLASASAVTMIFSSLLMQSAEAVTSNPVPTCVGASCTVTFPYSGDSYSWSPPAGATSVSFDLQGAQGGSVGGKGGRVTGTFLTTPSSLLIYVGGIGAKGSGSQGGFNGGGAAGVGFGDEGSGGGSTDLRTTSALSSRVAIAAGGGGSGGAIGGAGGIGGGLQGYAGDAAQTEGGNGGTQANGGRGGLAYGGTNGTAGALGTGGIGGSSAYAAGGGGGGGLFGGGGGGATLDDCCYGFGAGGGGGGSSFASASVVASPTHTLGFRAGSGLAKISYVAPPEVVSFATATTLSNQDGVVFSLSFNQSVTGLTIDDFSQTANSCTAQALTGSGANYTVTLSGCPDGSHQLSLAINAVFGASSGPNQSVNSNSMLLDQTAPVATWLTSSSTTYDLPIFEINFAESISGLTIADFEQLNSSGCTLTLTELSAGAKYSIETATCTYGQVQLAITAGTFKDAALNPGLSSQSASVAYVQQPVATPTSTPTPTPTPTPTAEVLPPSSTPTPAPPSSPAPVEPIQPAPVEPPQVILEIPVVEAPAVVEAPRVVERPAVVETPAVVDTPATSEAPAVVATQSPFEEAPIEIPIDETPAAIEVAATPEDQLAPEVPTKALPQTLQSIPIQVMQSATQDAAGPDLVGLVYLALGIAGAATIYIGLASLAKTFRLRRRLLTS